MDCDHPRRTCYNTVILEGATELNRDRLHVILVGQSVGL